jgi:DNA-binding LytR/AlgR family response regulator
MATAIIAEDEPLLAAALQAELKALWPELQIVVIVGDGQSALEQALTLRPQVLFLDIRMPELSGIEAALELVDVWPQDAAFPAIVFVTAYDEYALQAFEARAIDYLVKPVQTQRLAKTIERLKAKIGAVDLAATILQFQVLLQTRAPDLPILHRQAEDQGMHKGAPQNANQATTSANTRKTLRVIQAGIGNSIRMIPIEEVILFEAADKYVRVVLTDGKDYLIRKALKELIDELDSELFWQVHRGALVRASAIESIQRDEGGRQQLQLKGLSQALTVSRMYSHLFKAM